MTWTVGASARLEAYDRSRTDANGTTFYYYDADGRLRFTVDPVGDVTETRYNALGQIGDQIAYRTPIATTGLTGGLLTAALTTQLTASASSALDAHTSYTYSIDGQWRSERRPRAAASHRSTMRSTR